MSLARALKSECETNGSLFFYTNIKIKIIVKCILECFIETPLVFIDVTYPKVAVRIETDAGPKSLLDFRPLYVFSSRARPRPRPAKAKQSAVSVFRLSGATATSSVYVDKYTNFYIVNLQLCK